MEESNQQCKLFSLANLMIIKWNNLFFSSLLTRDGALLAYSGFESKDAKIIAAMASSIFAAHQRVRQTPGPTLAQNIVGSGDLNMILLDAEVIKFNEFSALINKSFLGRKNGYRCSGYTTYLYGSKNKCTIRNAQS